MRTREVDIFEQREKEQAVKLEKEKKKAKIVGITKIKLDAYVALKIIKHCREEKRASSGMLLGLVKETYLQITNSLPSFQVAPEEKDVRPEILESLARISPDFANVGWYQSSPIADFVNEQTLDGQYNLQKQFPQCVCLIYDISKSENSFNALKAIRLTKVAMSTLSLLVVKGKKVQFEDTPKFSKLSIDVIRSKNLTKSRIFEEVPIQIERPHLFQAFLVDHFKPPELEVNSKILRMTNDKYLENKMKYLNSYLEDMATEQAKLYEYKKSMRTRGKRQIAPSREEEPDMLDHLMIAKQIDTFCDDINEFASLNLGKTFILQSLAQK